MEINQAIAIKEELLEIYRDKQQEFKHVIRSFPHDDLAGPFLMSPAPAYQHQPNPLLVIGQETNGWTYFVDDLERQMKTYEEFGVGKDHKASAFWKLIRRVEELMGNTPYSTAWTNLSKFDLYGKRSYGKYEKAIAGLDDMIVDEIRIASPKVCLFFTGPYFDARLSAVYDELEFVEIEGWPLKQFCRLKHPLLPAHTYRSYHPKSLRLRSLEQKFFEFMSALDLPL